MRIRELIEKAQDALATLQRFARPSHPAEPAGAEDDPLEFRGDILIDVPRARVFELLDFASPGHHLRERGFVFDAEAQAGAGQTFRATAPDLEGMTFVFTVEHHQPPHAIAFKSAVESTFPVGNLIDSRSVYVLHAVAPNQTRVELVELPRFPDNMPSTMLAEETAIMAVSVSNELAKLKAHAEQGAEAALAMDDLAFDRKVA